MATCFKGLGRSIHNYKDYEVEEMNSYASTDSDAANMEKPTLITSLDGTKKWTILTITPDGNIDHSLQEIEKHFSSYEGIIEKNIRGKVEDEPKSHFLSYVPPDLSEMEKSWLKTQLILGVSVKIFGKSVGKMVVCAAVGGTAGLVVGIFIGGAVGGIAGGVGVVPGAAVGGLIGAGVGGAAGAGYGVYRVIRDGKVDVNEFYRDFQILKDVEDGSHKSVRSTIVVAQEFFSYYLEELDGKEMGPMIFCPLSLDIMLFPVKANCGDVYELLSITKSLKESKQCPLCRRKVEKLTFDFETMKAIRDAVRGALGCLRESAGNQRVLLWQKQFKITKFDRLDQITRAKIKNGTPLSLAEKRILYHIFKEYSRNFERINRVIKDTLSSLLSNSFDREKIDLDKYGKLRKQLQEYFK